MGEEFKEFEVEAPVLTLEPDLTEEKEEIAKKESEKPQEPAVEEPVLSPQERSILKIQTRSCSTEPALRRRWQIFLMQRW